MQLITVKLVHADGRIIKVNANEVPVWKSRGFNAPKEGKTSGGESRDNKPSDNKPADKPADDKPADNKPADDGFNDVII